MPIPELPEAPAREGLVVRLLSALGQATARQSTQPTEIDFLGPLGELEKRVADTWPDAKPSGDGVDYRDEVLKVLTKRLRWRFRIQAGEELVRLLGRFAGVAVAAGVAWSLFVT
jgi:hypothetical protein